MVFACKNLLEKEDCGSPVGDETAPGFRARMNQKLIREIGRTQRLDILTALKKYGSMTVKELSTGFRMSYMGIKQHCLELEKEGYLDTWRRPSRVGRPEMLYRLTARGLEVFPGADNTLTIQVLEAVQGSYGPAAPTKMLFGIFAQRAEHYRREVSGHTLAERARSFAAMREVEGYMSEFETEETEGGEEAGSGTVPEAGAWCIVDHHSPIEDLLRRFPIIARLERELFERVLGVPFQRAEEARPAYYRCRFCPQKIC